MLPAALAAGEAAATDHVFLSSLASHAHRQLATDLRRSRRRAALWALLRSRAAWRHWERAATTAPDWLDVDADAPPHVVMRGRSASTSPAAKPAGAADVQHHGHGGPAGLIDRVGAAGPDDRPDAHSGPRRGSRRRPHPRRGAGPAFADHDRLLPECALVVCHGGLGTVLRALAHGVPMLILPLGRVRRSTPAASRRSALTSRCPRYVAAAHPICAGRASRRRVIRAAAVAAGRRIAAAHPPNSRRSPRSARPLNCWRHAAAPERRLGSPPYAAERLADHARRLGLRACQGVLRGDRWSTAMDVEETAFFQANEWSSCSGAASAWPPT